MKKAIFLFDYTNIMAKPWADAGYLCYCFDGQHPQGVSKSDHPNILNVGMWFSNDVTGDISGDDVDKIMAITGDDVSFVFGFPECTNLAVSGAGHFASKRDANPAFQDEAMVLVCLVHGLGEKLGCKWGLENPISVISTMWRKPDFKFHPHEYGGYLPKNDIHPSYPKYIKPRDAYPKNTCIWSGNGLIQPKEKCVGPGGIDLVDGKLDLDNPKIKIELSHFNEKLKLLIEADTKSREFERYDDGGNPIWGYSDQHKKLGGKSIKTKNIRSATPRGFAQAVFDANGIAL